MSSGIVVVGIAVYAAYTMVGVVLSAVLRDKRLREIGREPDFIVLYWPVMLLAIVAVFVDEHVA